MSKSDNKTQPSEVMGQAAAENTKGNGNATENNPSFAIQRIYLKDLSFETPNSPQLFREDWNPNVNLELTVNSHKLEQDVYEVILQITTTVKSNEKVAFLAEVQQAGIFTLQGFADQQLHHTLGSYCPNILFPYAREAISNLVVRGGFPQLYLAPINFDAVYAQQQQQKAQPKETDAKS